MPGSENSTAIMFYYVYVMESLRNGSLYIGFTNNLKKRLGEHNRGFIFRLNQIDPGILSMLKLIATKKMSKGEKNISRPAKALDS